MHLPDHQARQAERHPVKKKLRLLVQIHLFVFLGDNDLPIGSTGRRAGRLDSSRGRLPHEWYIMRQAVDEFDAEEDEEEKKA